MADIRKRVTPAGTESFQVRIRRAGFPTLTRSHKTKAAAQKWAREEESKLLNGLEVLTSPTARITFSDAIRDYLDHKSTKTPSEIVRLRQIEADLGDLAVKNLTSAKFSAYIKTWLRTEVAAPKTKKKAHPLFAPTPHTYAESSVRKIYYLVKKVMEWHSSFRKYPIENIFKSVSPPSTDIKRDRRLQGNEEQRLLLAIEKQYVKNDELRTVILFALETAMRAGEILSIQWHEINFESRSIKIPKEKTKTARYREVPMTSICVNLLQAHIATMNKLDDRVFWQWKDSHALGQRFRVILKNAEIKDFRFHDLRHEATSRFFERTTLRDIEIAKITGHSDMRTLARYANLRTENLAKLLW